MQLPAAGILRSGSARLGRFQKDGLPSRSRAFHGRVQGHQLALRGAARSLPLSIESDMDAKAHHLVLLAAISLFCAIVTWAGDRDLLGSGFFALGMAAIWGAALPHRR